jgi:uncharacterized protein YndB with AHSA1/START domain
MTSTTGTIGDLVEVDGGWELRYERRLAHAPEKVWRAITETDHLEVWFPHRIRGEFVVGNTLTFGSHDGEGDSFEGTVTAVDPPRLLAFTWGGDQLTIELTPDGEGTVLTFVDTITELGKAARDGAGWHACIDALVLVVDDDKPDWEGTQRWAQVHPSYVETFGPEAATIGPPAGKV